MHQKGSRKPDPCEFCSTEFLHLRDLHVHKLESHQGKGLSTNGKDQLEKCRCSICGIILSNFSNVKRHENSHAREKKKPAASKGGTQSSDINVGGQLDIRDIGVLVNSTRVKSSHVKCDKKFANAGNVQRHKSAMHEIESRKPDPCELCGTECLNLRDLHLHKLESHQGEGLSALEKDQLEKCKCSICGKILANFSNMKRHHELHHKIGFQSKLKQHQRSQHTSRSQRKPTENNKWICRECEQSFESQILLRKHYKTHDNKCYRCEKCGKSFGMKHSLSKHVMCHRYEGQFECPICRKVFAQKWYMQNHLRVTHSTIRPYSCNQCEKSLQVRTSLLSHRRIVHEKDNKQHLCTACGKMFKTKGNFNLHFRGRHTNETPYVCPVCSKGFRYNTEFKSHMQRHSQGLNFLCELCGKAFKTQVAVSRHRNVTHSNVFPYTCPLCGKVFKVKAKMKAHLARHR
ncbi:zinc finger protein 665-like [Ptychodera flava]|uniref:zinc finger protein 665-like n=1 Tax=Ptychodera flava TaxID=63121 RepID=UPI00396A7058